MQSFADLGLPASLLEAATNAGYTTPTPIQAQAIPLLLQGRDVLGLAHTGSGKTAAFALPLLSTIDASLAATQALILTPTRELANQVSEALEGFASRLPLQVVAVYGGAPMAAQRRALKSGAHIVVGTPGRLCDHLERGALRLDQVRCAVLDEADEMLRMGFIEDLERLLGAMPEKRQSALFSATLPNTIQRIARERLNDPVEVKIHRDSEDRPNIEQAACIIAPPQRFEALCRHLVVRKPDAAIVFCATKAATESLASQLNQRGFSASALNGDMEQAQRERTVQALINKRIHILVATDVAARGLDVQRITDVINFDAPHDPEIYTHRIGRTGRAGRSGRSMVFLAARERYKLRQLERATQASIAVEEPATAKQTQATLDGTQRESMGGVVENTALMQRTREQLERLLGGELAAPLPDEVVALFAVQAQQQALPYDPRMNFEAPRRDSQQRERGGRFDSRDRKPRSGSRDGSRDGARDGARGAAAGGKRPSYDKVQHDNMVRLSIGRADGIGVGDIVGAIANELGIAGREIGPIRIRDDFSMVGLPENTSMAALQKLHIRGKRAMRGQGEGSGPPPRRRAA